MTVYIEKPAINLREELASLRNQGISSTDTPSFAGLNVSGTATVGTLSSTTINLADNIVHTGDTNTSFGFPSNDTITLTTAGSEAMRVASSGNVGIGVTNPTSRLDVSGTVAARGNLVAGSDTAVGSNLFVNSTTNRVGINNATPDESLHVVGTIKITPSITSVGEGLLLDSPFAVLDNYITLATAGTKRWAMAVDAGGGSPTNAFYIWDDVNDTYPFAILPGANSETLVVDGATDRVGIGTASPSATLDVTASNSVIEVTSTGASTGIHQVSSSGHHRMLLDGSGWRGYDITNLQHTYNYVGGGSGYWRWYTNGTERLRIDSSGNVGIGTSSPTNSLHISKQSADVYSGSTLAPSGVGNSIFIDNTDNTVGSFGQIVFRNGSSGQIFNRIASVRDASGQGSLAFVTGNSSAAAERLRIDSSGNVGIGLTNPTVRLDVSGTVAARGNLVAGSDTLVGSKFHVNSTTGVTRAQGAVQISNALAGREGFLTLADGNNAASTDLWTLSVDSTATNSFYMWDDVNSRYHFAVKPGTATSGTLVVDGSNGRVGVGTASPATALDVAGTVTANQVSLGDNEKAIFGAGSDLQIYHTGANSIIADNGAGKLILSGNGTAIDIYDNANAQTMASFTNNGAVTVGYQGSTKLATTSTGIDVTGNAEISGDLTVDTNTLHVDSATNRVGIRNTSPNAPLHVTGPTRIQNDFTGREGFLEMYSGTGAGTARWTLSIDSTASNSFYLWDEQNSSYPFAVKPGANSETLVVDGSTDRVGIGTASPGYNLDVNGSARVTGRLQTNEIRTNNGTEVVINAGESANYATGQTGESVYLNAETAIEFVHSPDNWASGWAGRVTSRFTHSLAILPQVFSSTSALGTNVRVQTDGQLVRSTSSLKYKHNVEDADLALSEVVVYGSRPVWYQSLSDLDNDAWGFWGFVAEELHEVDPRLVDYAEDENGDLTPDGVQYDRFVVHLVNVAQQQKAKIDDLESRLAALEANI